MRVARLLGLVGLVGLGFAAIRRAQSPRHAEFLIGTQGESEDTGIFRARLDEETGALALIGLAAQVARATWLLRHPSRPFVFAVSELGNKGDRDGEVLSFEDRGSTEPLKLIDRTPSLGGGPTHLDIEPDGSALFVANFGGGQVTCVPVSRAGKLAMARPGPTHIGSGPHRRQQAPHPHGVTLDPSQRYLIAPDMGADQVFVHRYDRTTKTISAGGTTTFALPPGSGPRLLCFGRDDRIAYLLTELSAELFTLGWDPEMGSLSELGRVALDSAIGEGEPSAAALVISRDGRRLYASNRRASSIEVFAIDRASGLLSPLQTAPSGGPRPWAAALSPGGGWLLVANQAGDEICSIRVSRNGEQLVGGATGRITVPSPTAIVF